MCNYKKIGTKNIMHAKLSCFLVLFVSFVFPFFLSSQVSYLPVVDFFKKHLVCARKYTNTIILLPDYFKSIPPKLFFIKGSGVF